MTGPVITEEYRTLQQKLHEDNPDYGMASVAMAPLVVEMIGRLDATHLLDYGAGKGRLGQELLKLMKTPPIVTPYEPSRPEWATPPAPHDFVTCIDVLEHIEPELLDNVLDDLARVTRRFGLFTVHTGQARRVLPDGRNVHLIQEGPAWWLPRLLARFELIQFTRIPQGFWVLVERQGEQAS
ncbi:MAG: hypothetical protein HQL42_14410 [Alphaproteobacteria bacterium]|nr:hypothetical protein [Alphaproteobacteria bacterium]